MLGLGVGLGLAYQARVASGPPVNLIQPSISGIAQVGQTLTGSRGSWAGSTPITYDDEWRRDGVAISGATGLTYLVDDADVGALLSFFVTATNSEGSDTASSASVGPVELPPALLITGPAGGEGDPSLVLTLDEGETVVGTFTFSEDATGSLSGTDAALFELVELSPTTVSLRFLVAPDFDDPDDADTDNAYEVTVEGETSDARAASQAVSVEVQNVFDNVPALSSASPDLLATDVPIDTTIVLTFDRPISLSADPYAGIWTGSPTYSTLVHEWTSADIGSGAGEMDASGDTLTLRLPSDLEGLTDYRWALDPGAVEAADGSPNAALEGTFTTEDVDTTAPTLSDTDYSGGTVTFTSDETGTDYWGSHPDGAPPTGAQLVAGTGGGIYEAGSFPVDAGYNDESITLTSATPDGTVGLSHVVQDAAGNISAVVTHSVSHNAAAPTIASSSPADNATGVAVSGAITITFSEPIAFGDSGTITLRDVAGASDVEVFDVATDQGTGAGQVSISGAVLTIRPTADRANSTEYAIRISAGAIEDVGGLPFAGIADDTTLSWTTVAAGGPIFEIDASSDPGQGSFATDTGSATFTYDGALSKTFPNHGARTGAMVCDHSTNGAQILVGVSGDAPVTPGQAYTVDAAVTYNMGSTGTTMRARIEWVRADGTFSAGESSVLVPGSTGTNTNQTNTVMLDNVYGPFTAPANAVRARLALQFNSWATAQARFNVFKFAIEEA